MAREAHVSNHDVFSATAEASEWKLKARGAINMSRVADDDESSRQPPLNVVDGTLFILGDPPRNCSCIVVQILISVEVRLFQ